MQTCQINFAGREGCDCCEIASASKVGWGHLDGWMDGGGKGMLEVGAYEF